MLLSYLVIVSCKSRSNDEKENILFLDTNCFRENDSTLHLTITNKGSEVIFLPGKYFGLYTENDDTVGLEAFDSPSYDTTYYYLYRNVLTFPFLTNERLQTKPDSVFYTLQGRYFNQFRIGEFVALEPTKTFHDTLHFKVPKRTTDIKIVFYMKRFENDSLFFRGAYLFEDFSKFNQINGKYAYTKLVDIYRVPDR